jgi:hypothetical protein
LEALKNGDYYSSTGPQIYDVQVNAGNQVIVKCSPAERVFITGSGSSAVSALGRGIRSATLSLSRFSSPYFRVVVRDQRGRQAWSNPYWLES